MYKKDNHETSLQGGSNKFCKKGFANLQIYQFLTVQQKNLDRLYIRIVVRLVVATLG